MAPQQAPGRNPGPRLASHNHTWARLGEDTSQSHTRDAHVQACSRLGRASNHNPALRMHLQSIKEMLNTGPVQRLVLAIWRIQLTPDGHFFLRQLLYELVPGQKLSSIRDLKGIRVRRVGANSSLTLLDLLKEDLRLPLTISDKGFSKALRHFLAGVLKLQLPRASVAKQAAWVRKEYVRAMRACKGTVGVKMGILLSAQALLRTYQQLKDAAGPLVELTFGTAKVGRDDDGHAHTNRLRMYPQLAKVHAPPPLFHTAAPHCPCCLQQALQRELPHALLPWIGASPCKQPDAPTSPVAAALRREGAVQRKAGGSSSPTSSGMVLSSRRSARLGAAQDSEQPEPAGVQPGRSAAPHEPLLALADAAAAAEQQVRTVHGHHATASTAGLTWLRGTRARGRCAKRHVHAQSAPAALSWASTRHRVGCLSVRPRM